MAEVTIWGSGIFFVEGFGKVLRVFCGTSCVDKYWLSSSLRFRL